MHSKVHIHPVYSKTPPAILIPAAEATAATAATEATAAAAATAEAAVL